MHTFGAGGRKEEVMFDLVPDPDRRRKLVISLCVLDTVAAVEMFRAGTRVVLAPFDNRPIGRGVFVGRLCRPRDAEWLEFGNQGVLVRRLTPAETIKERREQLIH